MEALKQQANYRHALWLALAVIVGVGVWLVQPAPAHVQRERARLAQAAPRCVGMTKAGLPCLNRTHRSSKYCWRHEPAVYDSAKMIRMGPPVGQRAEE